MMIIFIIINNDNLFALWIQIHTNIQPWVFILQFYPVYTKLLQLHFKYIYIKLIKELKNHTNTYCFYNYLYVIKLYL